MSSRLASFKGPSTPTKNPAQPLHPQSPASPSRQIESTFHRKARTHLQELCSLCETWDDLVIHDGLKYLKLLIDTRTELECDFSLLLSLPLLNLRCSNALAALPDRRPRTYLVGPKLQTMERCLAALDAVIQKLVCTIFCLASPRLYLDTRIKGKTIQTNAS